MAEQTNMICPSCETFQPKAEICNTCGVIIAKAQQAVSGGVQKPVAQETSKPPIAKFAVILLIAIPVIGFVMFSGTDNVNETGNVTDSASSNASEKTKTKKTDPIDQIAAFNPAVAENIRRTNVLSKLHSLKTMLYMFGTEGEEPPSNEEGLQALVDNGFLTQSTITDDWGNIFIYRLEWGKETPWGKEYKIYVHSKGPDGISGNSDDMMMP